jgi:hypothetical protein
MREGGDREACVLRRTAATRLAQMKEIAIVWATPDLGNQTNENR